MATRKKLAEEELRAIANIIAVYDQDDPIAALFLLAVSAQSCMNNYVSYRSLRSMIDLPESRIREVVEGLEKNKLLAYNYAGYIALTPDGYKEVQRCKGKRSAFYAKVDEEDKLKDEHNGRQN